MLYKGDESGDRLCMIEGMVIYLFWVELEYDALICYVSDMLIESVVACICLFDVFESGVFICQGVVCFVREWSVYVGCCCDAYTHRVCVVVICLFCHSYIESYCQMCSHLQWAVLCFAVLL